MGALQGLGALPSEKDERPGAASDDDDDEEEALAMEAEEVTHVVERKRAREATR